LRITALGGIGDADHVIEACRQQLVALLSPLIQACPRLARNDDAAVSLQQASAAVRKRWFEDVEAQCADYEERKLTETALPAILEWEAWASLRNAAESILKIDPASADTLFQTMYVRVCNFGAFQINRCQNATLAHDMFTWLASRGKGDGQTQQLLSNNIKVTLNASA